MPYLFENGTSVEVSQTEYNAWVDKVAPPPPDPVTLQQSQSTSQQTPPGPIAYGPPQTQTFDDGSTLTTNADGTVSSTDSPSPTAASTPGVGAATDDNSNGANTISGTNLATNSSTSPTGLISPQPNILDQFASYTYNIGWYLLTPDQMNVISVNSKIDISQWSLLVQSGGGGSEQSGLFQAGTAASALNPLVETVANTLGFTTLTKAGRNKYFTLDYYLDDLEIEQSLTGDGPGVTQSINFKVYEPNGITLLPNLNNAVRDLYNDLTTAGNLAFYCLVIKFYGWDINGNLITDATQNVGIPGVTPSISNSIITRYYPFTITNFNFKIQSKVICYEIAGQFSGFKYASSTGTGSIPFNFELVGQTVGQVLSGNGATSAITPASDGRGSTPNSPQSAPPTPVQNAPATVSYNSDGSVNASNLSGYPDGSM